MVNIEDLSRQINSDIHWGSYYFAYGVLKETYELWQDPDNRKMLCGLAHFMLDQIKEGKESEQ